MELVFVSMKKEALANLICRRIAGVCCSFVHAKQCHCDVVLSIACCGAAMMARLKKGEQSNL
jgi:hypothetical protein